MLNGDIIDEIESVWDLLSPPLQKKALETLGVQTTFKVWIDRVGVGGVFSWAEHTAGYSALECLQVFQSRQLHYTGDSIV